MTSQLGLVDPITKQIFLPQEKDQIIGMTQNHELLEINSQTNLRCNYCTLENAHDKHVIVV
jgi:hypothetical protein